MHGIARFGHHICGHLNIIKTHDEAMINIISTEMQPCSAEIILCSSVRPQLRLVLNFNRSQFMCE